MQLAETASLRRVKAVVWRWWFRSGIVRRIIYAYRWSRFRDRAFELTHLAFFQEEDAAGPLQRDEALLLYGLVRVLRPQVVVELGFLRGRSALNFLLALPPGGKLYSFDNDPEAAAAARRYFGDRPDFRFVLRSQVDITPGDVDNRPVDLVFLDASHDLELNRRTFARLQEVLAEDGVIVVHDTGTWPAERMRIEQRDYAAASPGGWVSEAEYAHRPEEREFVNWLRETHPEFAQVNLHTLHTVRHGMTILQRSRPLALPARDRAAVAAPAARP